MVIKGNILTSTSSSLGQPDRRWKLNGKSGIKDIIVLEVTLSSLDGQTLTINDSRITSKHVVLETVIEDAVGTIIE